MSDTNERPQCVSCGCDVWDHNAPEAVPSLGGCGSCGDCEGWR